MSPPGLVCCKKEKKKTKEGGLSPQEGDAKKRKEKKKTKEGGLSPQEGDVKKKKTKEGEKVAPPKARFRVPLTKNFFFGSQVFGF